MDYHMRPATAEDVDTMVAMHTRLQAHLERRNPATWRWSDERVAALPEDYRDLLRNPTARTYVIEHGPSRSIVAFGSGSIKTHTQSVPGRSGHVTTMRGDAHTIEVGCCWMVETGLLYHQTITIVQQIQEHFRIHLGFLHGDTHFIRQHIRVTRSIEFYDLGQVEHIGEGQTRGSAPTIIIISWIDSDGLACFPM